MPHVIIFDDQPLIRIGAAVVLADFARVQQAESMSELKDILEQSLPSVLILGFNSQDLDTLIEFRQLYPHLPILVLSLRGEPQAGVRAVLAGASGYLPKTCSTFELVDAVRQIESGIRYVSLAVGAALAEYVFDGKSHHSCHHALSPREYTVLLKISTGLTTAKIAGELGLSPKTVGTYRARLLEKMGVGTTAELTRYVVEKGLMENRSIARSV